MAKQRRTIREKRADCLLNWFMKVYDGRKAPLPRRSLRGIACLMREHLAGSDYTAYRTL
jgi:hypothetical protein